MGAKSRGGWMMGMCLKECCNRGEKCEDCLRFSNYKPINKDKQRENQSETRNTSKEDTSQSVSNYSEEPLDLSDPRWQTEED